MNAPDSETALLDFPSWVGSQDPDTRRGVEQILAQSADPETEKQKIASMLAVHEAHPEIDLPTINSQWGVIRGGFAEQQGGPWQAAKDDDTAFHGLLVQQAQTRRNERRLLSGPDDTAAPDSKEATAASLEGLTFNAALLGHSASEAFKTWQQTAQGKPGFDPGRADFYLEQARALHDSVTQRFSPVLELADDAFQTLSTGKDLETASERLLPQVDQLSDAQRRDFLSALRVMADHSPDATKATFWGNFAKQAGRDISGTGRGFMDALAAAGGAQAIGDAGLSEMSGAAPEGFQRQLLQDFGKSLREHNLESDLRRVQEQDFSPVREVLPKGWRWAERGAYAAPGALAFTAEGMIPGFGMPALFGTMASQAYEQERFRLTDAGLNDADASRQAATLAPIIAAPQAALMELRIGALAGKFPALKSALTALGDKAGGGLAGYGVRVAGHAAAQLPLLQGMSLMQPTVEAAAAALDKDLPGVTWRNGKDGVLDGWWTHTGESFVSLLPLVLTGAAFSGTGQADALKKASDTQLRAFGAKPEDISAFRAAVEKGPVSAIEAAQNLMTNRDGNSDAAKAAAEELTAQERQRAAMNDAKLSTDTREAGVSSIVRSGDGWTLIHDDGTRTQAGSDRAAVAIVSDLKQAATKAEAAALVAIIDRWHEAAPEGTQRETTLTGDTAQSSGDSITYSKPGAGVVREVTDGATLDALRKEARMDARGAGAEDIDVLVNGSNEVQFRERVADGAREVVQRLELNQSESAALTALHEQIESAWRTGIAQGTISAEETQKAVGSIAPALDPARARNEADRSFRERVQRVAEGKADETEIRETVSELAVADVIGRRKDGGAMPAGSVTAALDAAILNAADPAEAKQLGRFRAFLRSARQLLRGVLGTVAAIKKAKREGGAKELGELVNKLTGLDEQAAHDDALAQDLEQTSGLPDYQPPTPEEQAAGIAFSLGKVGAIGYVDSYGAVHAKPLNSEEELGKLEHAPIFGAAAVAGADRFRFDRLGGVEWTRPPSDESKQALENWLARRLSARSIAPIQIGGSEVTPERGTRAFPTQSGGLIGPASFSLSAYHGTPHKVDKFDLDKIGTGEGAQVYGWGLYFAENPDVAEHYRKNLSESYAARDGKQLRGGVADATTTPERRAEILLAPTTSKEEALKKIAESGDYLTPEGVRLAHEMIAGGRVEWPRRAGNTYEVKLKVEPEDLLDWNKSLSEQSAKVLTSLQKLANEPGYGDLREALQPFELSSSTGETVYKLITKGIAKAQHTENDVAARGTSEGLHAFGISGIRYLDQGSRPGPYRGDPAYLHAADSFKSSGADSSKALEGMRAAYPEAILAVLQDAVNAAYGEAKGTHNYVIFDHSKIEITHENGTPAWKDEGISFSVSKAPDSEAPAGYSEMVKESGFPAVSIGHLAERSGIPLGEMKARVLAAWSAGRVVLSQGDWSHADESTRAGSVTAGGDRYLQVRWLPDEQAAGGSTFSLAPSTPERDARQLTPIAVPDATLSGDRSDWRRAVRSFITANLQGRTLVNRDTGTHIGFTGESKSESVGKLRAEPHFRAAMELPSIVENAVLLGDVPPRPERSGGTERFQYFALPVTIGDKSAVAWFNTRKQLRGGDSIFYEFGLHETEAAQTSPGLGTKAEPSSNTPTLGPAETVGAFIARIKDTLPAAMKVGDVQSFSISPGSRLETIQRRIEATLAQDPERRRELQRAANEKLQRLRSEMETVRYTPKGDEIRPLVERRSAASLDKEQAFREADRAEELTAEGMGKLSPSTLRALEHGEQKLKESILVGTMLSDHGKLVSKSRAAREGRYGEFDDAPWLPPSWYSKSGGFLPDEMAQMLHDAGLLREPTPNALWAALAAEIQTTRKSNASFEEASAKAKEIEKQARNQAREETFEWRRQEDEKQAKDHSPRARLVRDLRTLDSILSVFPAEVRTRVGGFVKLAQLGSDAARVKEIERRVEKLGGLLETYLQKESRARIAELFDRARPEMKPGEKPRGKMTREAHELAQMAERASQVPEAEMDGERAKIETALLEPGADLASLAERLQVLEYFGGMDKANAAQLDTAAKWLENVIRTGRNQWRMVQEQRLEQWKQDAAALKADTGKAGDIADLQRDLEKEKTLAREMGGWGFALISFEQTVNAIYGKESTAGQRLIEKVRAATYQRTDAVRAKQKEWNAAMRGIFKRPWHETLLALWEHAQVNGDLSIKVKRMAGRVSKVETIPLEIAERAINGSEETQRALGFSSSEIAQLETLVDENAAKDHPRVNVDLERFSEGKPTETPLSQLQAVDLLMMARQRDQMANLDFHGWTAETLREIEGKLTPEAREIMAWLTEQYRAEYGPLNSVFERMFGAPLPKNENYSPLHFESLNAGKDLTPDGSGAVGLGGLSPGALKTRRVHRAAPKLTDALASFWSHFGQMEHFKAFAEVTREARAVMLRPEVRASVKEKAGANGLAALHDWVSVFENDGVRSSAALTALDRLNTRLQSAAATTVLAWNVGTLVKQSLAVLNPAYEMPSGAFLRGFGKLIGGRLDFRQIFGSEMIRRRVEAGASPELRQVMAGLAGTHPGKLSRRPRELVQKGMDLIGAADGFFTAAGAAIHFDWAKREALAAGMSEAAATDAAMRKTQGMVDRTAQPVELMNRSLFEAKNAGNPAARWLFMFASEARQKAALYVEALSNVLQGKASAKDATVLVVSHVIVPVILQTMVNILRDAHDDDDDTLFDPQNWNPRDYLKAMAMGPLSGFPLLGNVADSLISSALGRPAMQSNPTNPLNRVNQIIPAAKKMMSEKESEPFEKGVNAAATAMNMVAMVSAFFPQGGQPVQWVGAAGNAMKQALQFTDDLLPDTSAEAEKKAKAADQRERKKARGK